MKQASYGKRIGTASASLLVAISLALLSGCGITATIQSAHSQETTTPSSSVSPSSTPQTSRVFTQSTPASHHGPGITLSGTLSADGTASFPAWVGGTTASGQWVWVSVTVQLDSGAQMSQVSGAALTSAGIAHTTQTSQFYGIGGTTTGYLFPNLSLVPKADSRGPIFVHHDIYSGLGPIGSTVGVNIGQDLLQNGDFQINGSHWTYTYLPATTLSAPPASNPSSPLPTPGSSSPSTEYLGIEITHTPSDWSVQGCQVYQVLAGSPASNTPLIGQTQRTDPVGDVITQIADSTQG